MAVDTVLERCYTTDSPSVRRIRGGPTTVVSRQPFFNLSDFRFKSVLSRIRYPFTLVYGIRKHSQYFLCYLDILNVLVQCRNLT